MAVIQKCDLNSLNQLGKCFNCFSTIQNQAALVFFLSTRLAQLSGNPVQTPNQLRSTATSFKITSVDLVADSFDATVGLQGAIAAGVPGAANLTIAQIAKAMLQFTNMSLSDLRAIEVVLRCQLNNFP